jgi:hypothetical protein
MNATGIRGLEVFKSYLVKGPSIRSSLKGITGIYITAISDERFVKRRSEHNDG